MKHIPVKSSNVASIGYDPTARAMEVRFLNGGLYTHHEVPQHVYDALMAADSKGSHYAKTIRGRFRHTKADNT